MIPVVFIHKGNSAYLYNTFFQLRATNPTVLAYLIGTKESEKYEPLIKHVNIHAFEKEANAFGEIYQHFSTNSMEFELICIQRWFVLKEFMVKNNIQKCLYLDSDVLLYEDIKVLGEKYAHAGMTLCGISGHTNFIDKDVLIDFCNFIYSIYTSPEAYAELDEYYKAFILKHGAGGVSDMTLLTKYMEAKPNNVINIYFTDGQATFDPAFEIGHEYFVMKDNRKYFEFINSLPYGILKVTNQYVRFNTIHFQGANAKREMHSFIPMRNFGFYLNSLYFKIILLSQKVLKKL
ncbi:hypothetical protein [Cytophaga aurantiaca]|uniref:hypothetical protein n=1 Tax=Cytophaga aurantiaca TaxID=29530 RepID=UPI000367433B|nr:hypothetical protein [Cytophaga aurantiaca]